MTDQTWPTSVARKIVKAFGDKVQKAQVCQNVKNSIKDGIEKAKGIEGEFELQHFIQATIQQLPEPDRKVVEQCWMNARISIQQEGEKIPAPQDKQQVQAGVSSQHIDQKEDSFKFDSHSESYSSSYDDVDDDFRKEEMEQQENHLQ